MDCALNSHSGCIMSVETVAKKVILFVGAHFELISNYAALLVEREHHDTSGRRTTAAAAAVIREQP